MTCTQPATTTWVDLERLNQQAELLESRVRDLQSTIADLREEFERASQRRMAADAAGEQATF